MGPTPEMPDAGNEPREFWIDVGGTFTDCFARLPDGSLKRQKLLSSGITKGAVSGESAADCIVDPSRRRDPPRFWEGYELRLLDKAGHTIAQAKVGRFDPSRGVLWLDEPLSPAPRAGQIYELQCGQEAPLVAIRYLLAKPLDEPLPRVVVRLGTTRGTNALITRRGAKTALVTTRGFADVLEIGYQNRPRLFELDIHKPPPLFSAVIEIDERITAEGRVLRAPDPPAVRRDLRSLRARGIESLAICLLHAFERPDHERLVARIAREIGFDEISISSEVAPLVKIVSRGDTTVVDAYLNPVLRHYVATLRQQLGDGDLKIMTSAGGLVAAERFVGKDSILSGPAGGVVGFSKVARHAGFERAIGFDMGGTSTDVSRFDGRYELQYETEKAGVRLVAPMMAIETVAAGGGSICRFDGVKLVVGPQSAGADPGPACYAKGGPLSVTDVNLFLGKILPRNFPFPLDLPAVEARLKTIVQTIARTTGTRYTESELCDGFLRVANLNMVKAIRSISIAKGVDPRDYVLVAFGGAAGQHACGVARELGMRKVLIHPDAGILSALGIGLADIVRHKVAGLYRSYDEETLQQLEARFAALAEEGRQEVRREGIADHRIEVRRALDLRYRGVDAYLTIAEPRQGTYADAYDREHRKLYGYADEHRPLEIVAARVEVVGHTAEPPQDELARRDGRPTPQGRTVASFDARPHDTAVFDRLRLCPGDRIDAPALIHEPVSTTILDPGWRGEVLARGELLLTDEGHRGATSPTGGRRAAAEPDPVMLEIFNNQFAGIAERMGLTLRNTSSSVNVKERLDFSCALFTPGGDLVVNAPHIPVHLGAMSETVKQILRDHPDLRPGDVLVTNDPYGGGSHLPDVTVITPVFAASGRRLLFLTASRAHHAEIGGTRPGSMPPFSRSLAEEGVLIRGFKLVDAGRSRFDALRRLLLCGPYPTRNVADNLADLSAQVAANRLGIEGLEDLVSRYGLDTVEAYMRHIQDAAERKMRMSLTRLPDGRHEFVDHLDDGSTIAVSITISGDSAVIDFTGTSGVHPGNLNANRAIVMAAVMYCLRCLIAEEIPLNQGVLAPVRVIVPPGLLNPPKRERTKDCPAVVGGNVETSQRVVDVLFGALGVAAASQGTMNNLLFGDATFGYYETICGGAGATAGGAGADAVHTHMTNTRLTDPEVLERRYPVRLRRFAIRRGSGGQGRYRGGDGVVRVLEFLRPLEVSLLSQRRGPYPPFGLQGGDAAALGRNVLTQADGSQERLAGIAHFKAQPGDLLTIETPGGGGFGKPHTPRDG